MTSWRFSKEPPDPPKLFLNSFTQYLSMLFLEILAMVKPETNLGISIIFVHIHEAHQEIELAGGV